MFGLTKDQFLGRTSLDPAWKVIREDGFDYLGDEHPSMAALKTGNPVHNKVAGVLNPIKQDYVWLNINELINRKRNRFELEFKMKHKDGHWVDILSRANAVLIIMVKQSGLLVLMLISVNARWLKDNKQRLGMNWKTGITLSK
jgi:hypothetical protein